MGVSNRAKRLGVWSLAILTVLLVAGRMLWVSIQPPRLTAAAKSDQLISNVTIWNPGEAPLLNQTVVISDGIITDIRSTRDSDPDPMCAHCYVMPGLIDAHIHTPPRLAVGNQELFALLFLSHGVTSVRDMGQFDDSLPGFQQRLSGGDLIGPRLYRCGRILDGHPVSVPGAVAVSDAEDARVAVQRQASDGASCIKVYGNLSRDAFYGVAAEAERLGLPLTGHTPRALSLVNITDFEIQHYTGIPYLEQPAPAGWAYRSRDLIDMSPKETADVLATMRDNSLSFLPTNANARSRLTVSDPARFPPSPGLSDVPAFWETAWPSIVSHPETDAEIETEIEAMPVALRFIREAHAAEIDVLVGSDVIMPYVIPGESIHQQLALLTQALGSAELALAAATATNGQHIDEGRIGRVKVGAFADLLIFEDDPRGDIAKVQDWAHVMVDGRLYGRDEINAAVKRYRDHFRSGVYPAVMNTAYGFLASDYEDSEVASGAGE
ncbi:MAG: amidohydrolase family protein [Pseudomonadota bacterium]